MVSLSTRKALVWPTKNLEHIVGHAGDIRKHGFSLWGVGWKRRPKIDLPAEGYIVHMQKVVFKGIITDLLSTAGRTLKPPEISRLESTEVRFAVAVLAVITRLLPPCPMIRPFLSRSDLRV